MNIICGGVTNKIEYGAMINPSYDSDFYDKENNLYGYYGQALSQNDAPAIVWLDKEYNFVRGELC